MSCLEQVVHCGVEPMVLGTLGELRVPSEAVAVVPWGSGALRIAANGAGGVEAQAFDMRLSDQGPAVAVLPSVAGTQHLAVQARPVREGAVVVILERDVGAAQHRLLGVKVTTGGSRPQMGAVELLWEGTHLGAANPAVHVDVGRHGETLVLVVGTSDEAGASRLHLVRADLRGSQAPLVRALPLLPSAQTLPAGLTLTREGAVLLAGIDRQGTGGTLWVDQLNAELEVVETLWAWEQAQLPTSTSLISTPDDALGALGWFMPSPGEGEFAGLHRLEHLGAGLVPARTDIWLGPYFGPLQGGSVEQALAFHGEQLVQLSLELGPDGAGPGALFGILRMDSGVTSFNPWETRPLLRIPAADPRLHAQPLPAGGILATVPLLEDDGSHTLGLFRICLPL